MAYNTDMVILRLVITTSRQILWYMLILGHHTIHTVIFRRDCPQYYTPHLIHKTIISIVFHIFRNASMINDNV